MTNRFTSIDLNLLQNLPRPELAGRTAIIAGALLACLVIPQVIPSRLWVVLAGVVFVSGLVLALLRVPAMGPVLLIVVCLFVPSPGLPGGLNVGVLFTALLGGLWLLGLWVGRDKEQLVRSRPVTALLVFLFVVVLSFVVGQLRWFDSASPAPLDAQLGGLAIFLLSGVAFLVVAHQVRSLRWLQAMTWVFLFLGALHVAGWLESNVLSKLGGQLQIGATSNSMFWVWVAALAFSQAIYNRKLHPFWRIALGVLVVAVVYVSFVLNRDWKSGYLPVLVTLVVIVGARAWRLLLPMLVFAVLPAIFLSSFFLAGEEYSYLTRVEASAIILHMLQVNPILGFGPANYYWYTSLFPILGWYVQFNSHNQYVDILAQTGIVGLLSFAWFAAALGRLGWNLRRTAPDGFARAYVYGALGGLAGMLASGMLVDWFLPFTYNIGLTGFRGSVLAWLFLGGLVSIEQIMRREGGVSHHA